MVELYTGRGFFIFGDDVFRNRQMEGVKIVPFAQFCLRCIVVGLCHKHYHALKRGGHRHGSDIVYNADGRRLTCVLTLLEVSRHICRLG